MRQRSIKDFLHHHARYVAEWNKFEANCVPLFRMHREALFREYVGWFQSVARTKLCQRWTDADYADMGDSDDDNTLYDTRTREGSHV